eukprot:TRINITY_DN4506_c0_g1_i1.p1 TRINITY_DN4506_c0_g1~~TRINITY_DN4506_c0_g1_i1.p1  ORF type:complete len:473 (-),score=86.95 TRINITY_DN4506_c0_g1_i1:68-1486(-)
MEPFAKKNIPEDADNGGDDDVSMITTSLDKTAINEPQKQQKGNTGSLEDIVDPLDYVAFLGQFVDMFLSKNIDQLLLATSCIRKLLSVVGTPHIDEVIASGCTPFVVQNLLHENNRLAFESCWVISNIASGTSQHCQHLIKLGVIGMVSDLLLQFRNSDVIEQCLWCLGNLCGDSIPIRNMVLDSGFLSNLSTIKKNVQTNTSLENFLWCLSNSVRGKPSPPIHYTTIIIEFLKRNQFELLSGANVDILWTLSYLSERNEEITEFYTLEDNTLINLMSIIPQDNDKSVPSLRFFGNLLTGTDTQAMKLVNIGILDYLVTAMGTSSFLRDNFRKEIFWALSNITACMKRLVDSFLNHPIFPKFVQSCIDETNDNCTIETIWVFSNMVDGEFDDVAETLLNSRILEIILKWVQHPVHNSADGVKNVIEKLLLFGSKKPKVNGRNPVSARIKEARILEVIKKLDAYTNLIETFFE